MNNVINVRTPTDMWNCPEQLKEIRSFICAEPLSDLEFQNVIQTGRATGLNPFRKEIWVIKRRSKDKYSGQWKTQPAQVFIARDGYRIGAQRSKDYEYHQVNSVYSKYDIKLINGEIHHSFGFFDRGSLLGAYCIVKRKSSSTKMYVIVNLTEYSTQQSLWKETEKPETMIKKVAEAQGLRQAFQEVLGNTYHESENWDVNDDNVTIEGETQTKRLNNIINYTTGKNEQVSNDCFDNCTDNPASAEQVQKITQLLKEKDLPEERIEKAFSLYQIEELSDLNDESARRFISQLERI